MHIEFVDFFCNYYMSHDAINLWVMNQYLFFFNNNLFLLLDILRTRWPVSVDKHFRPNQRDR